LPRIAIDVPQCFLANCLRGDRNGRGIGGALLEKVEAWLFSEGCSELWLTTEVDTRLRAYSFYKKHGWSDWKIENGLRYMRKTGSSMKLRCLSKIPAPE
jgi:GNAT superfamily N-acetyltransferase